MTEPTPAELLAGVADALEQSVLPELDRGAVRNQVMAAIGIVRRCGEATDRYGPFLYADCVDLIATLRQSSVDDPALSDIAGQQLADALATGDRVLGEAYPLPSGLVEAHRALSEVLALLLLEAQRIDSDQLRVLRELLSRMAAREKEVGLSPW